ncbi:MarR family transcriptional regulator [bacterium]|nr:MarR family transcriptional regulator [bacterium]
MFGALTGDGACDSLQPGACPDGFMEQLGERDRLLVTLPPMIMHIGYLTHRIGDELIFEEYGLSTLRYAMLRHLSGIGEPVSMKQLAESMLKSPAGMTQNIDALEERGLVRRTPSPTDRRVNLIEVTKDGFELLERVNRHYIEKVREFMEPMSDEHLKTMSTLLFQFMMRSLDLLGLEFDIETFRKTHGIPHS